MNNYDIAIGKAISKGLEEMTNNLEELTKGAEIIEHFMTKDKISTVYNNGVVWSQTCIGFELKVYNEEEFEEYCDKYNIKR